MMPDETRNLCLGLLFSSLGMVILVSCDGLVEPSCCLKILCEDKVQNTHGCDFDPKEDNVICIPCVDIGFGSKNAVVCNGKCQLDVPTYFLEELSNSFCKKKAEKGLMANRTIVKRNTKTNRRYKDQETTTPLTTINTLSPCTSNLCKNGGTCNDRSGKAVCKCEGQWPSPFYTESPCSKKHSENGGTCQVDNNGVATCKCKCDWKAPNCTAHGLPKDKDGLDFKYFGLKTEILIGIIALLIVGSLWYTCRKCTKNEKKEPEPDQFPRRTVKEGNSAREPEPDQFPRRTVKEGNSARDNSRTILVEPERATTYFSESITQDVSETFVKELHGVNGKECTSETFVKELHGVNGKECTSETFVKELHGVNGKESHISDSSVERAECAEHANSGNPQAPRTFNQQPVSDDPGMILPGGQNSFHLFQNGIAPNHQDFQVIEHVHDSGLSSEEPNHICGHPSH